MQIYTNTSSNSKTFPFEMPNSQSLVICLKVENIYSISLRKWNDWEGTGAESSVEPSDGPELRGRKEY